MQPLKNDRFLRALRREPVDRTPIWVMRQAGRYLPEYRATRLRAGSFMTLCKTPELACEVSLQPIHRFALDASIIFSDILTIPDAMGLSLNFVEGEGPVFARPLTRIDDILKQSVPDLSQLSYVYEAIRLVRHELNGKVPLIGFCGSPFTLACYMVEGQSKNGFPRLHKMIEEAPLALHHLLDVLAESAALHLDAQIKAGAQAVMVFDTWGGMLTTANYHEFSLYYLKAIVSRLKTLSPDTPIILFTKGGGAWLEALAETGCDALSIDWTTSLQAARAEVGDRVALQGNLDPACLLSAPEVIRAEVARVLASYGQGAGHVFNLGHGITPDVLPDHMAVLVDAVHELSEPYHMR